jgi:hypothetical protein
MKVLKRDILATALVAVAGVLYGLWAAGYWSSVRATGAVVLALGFVASASAVVPGFEQLLRGNKTYLAVTSLIGLIAFIAGVQMLITASGTGLTVMMIAMGVLWAIATIHHTLLAKRISIAEPTLPVVAESHRRAA